MADFHSLLRRQLKRHFPDGGVPAGCDAMLQAIDDAYRQFDDDRAMLERSLDLSSQELLQANAELRALVSAFPDQILRLDADGVILDAKGGAHAEPTRRWQAGRPLLDGVEAGARATLESAFHRVSTERLPVSVELELGADTPTPRFYEARLLPMEDTQILLILRDVTERVLRREAAPRQPDRAARGAPRPGAPRRGAHGGPRARERRVAPRDGRPPGRRGRAHPARGTAAARAEDGGHRPALGRHRARLQQPAHRHSRLLRAAAARARGLAAARRRRGDPSRGRARRDAHRPAPRVQPQADPLARDPRAQPARDGDEPDAQPVDRRAHRDRPAARQRPVVGAGRRRAARAGPRQPRAQRARRDARRRPPGHRDRQPRPLGRAGAGPRHRAGIVRRVARARHGRGHPDRSAGAHLRAVLHHQAQGPGHGPRPLDGLRIRPPERRRGDGAERAGTRMHVLAAAAAH